MSLDRIVRAYRSRNRVLRKRIVEGDLTAATNGLAQSITVGVLPPGAVILGRATRIATYFTGGAATSVGMTLGVAGTLNGIMTTLNVFDTTALTINQQGTAGVNPFGLYDGSTILATLTPDAGHTLLALNAGDLTVDIYYAVPDLGSDPG